MRICRVIGTVIGSQISDGLTGPTYLLVEPTTTSGAASGAPIVAVDAVQAGEGDLVLLSQGSSCRQIQSPEALSTVDKAIDALVIGVIDLIDDNGSLTYRGDSGRADAGDGAVAAGPKAAAT
jgi:microcompartment protein CcmK/EutM